MYLDRHDTPGVTPEELAEAHSADLEVEQKYGVHYHTYWFDPDNGTVFCLAEGPSSEAVDAVHREAHGVLASSIIELDSAAPLNSFLGAPPSYPPGTAYSAPALRVIVFTDIRGSVEQTSQLGDEGHMRLLRAHNEIVRSALDEHGGNEVKHTGDGIMASFTSAASSLDFAISVQRALAARNVDDEPPLHVGIGISAGEPVTDDRDDLFGAAVQLAARLCAVAEPGEIKVSIAVRELAIGKPFKFVDRGPVVLKGMPEPTPVFAVAFTD